MIATGIDAKIEDGEEPNMFNWENLKNPLLSPINAPSCRTERSGERHLITKIIQSSNFSYL